MRSLTIALSSAAVLLAATLGAGAQDSWSEVEAAAKAEGRLVLYATVTNNMHGGAIEAFKSKYGIEVEQISARGNEIVERINTEQAAQRYIADVTINSTDTLWQHVQSGYLQETGALPAAEAISTQDYFYPEIVPVYYNNWAILLNTNLVSEEDEPKSWLDLLDPKWKGRIVLYDPRQVGPGAAWFRATYTNLGEEFHEKFVQQEPFIISDAGEGRRLILTGEYPIYVVLDYPFYVAEVNKGDRLPVKLTVPQEGAPVTVFSAGILNGAPNSNAARLFLNFLLTSEAQETYSEIGGTPVLAEAVKSDVDPKIRVLLEAPRFSMPHSSEAARLFQLAGQLYTK